MARFRDQEQVQKVVDALLGGQVAATIEIIRTDTGMEAEVDIAPTENLIAVSAVLARVGVELSYGASGIKVVPPSQGLPTETTSE